MRPIESDAILSGLIDIKYDEIKSNEGKFAKIKNLQSNYVGQIGEEYVKQILHHISNYEWQPTLHGEYDILLKSGIKIEVKTATKGCKVDSFQFNSINPSYNFDFLVCVGICDDKVMFRIFKKSEIKTIDTDGIISYYIEQDNLRKKISAMNPGNEVSHKLTLSTKQLHNYSTFIEELKDIVNQ